MYFILFISKKVQVRNLKKKPSWVPLMGDPAGIDRCNTRDGVATAVAHAGLVGPVPDLFL